MKIIKDNIDIFSKFIFHNFNNLIFDATFPSELKNAGKIPVFKKKDWNIIENYRPVSIFPNLIKIYERCLDDQADKYFIYSQNGSVNSVKALAHNTLFL